MDSSSNATNKNMKKVSFNVLGESDKEDSDGNEAPQITIPDDLLHNTKTYLS